MDSGISSTEEDIRTGTTSDIQEQTNDISTLLSSQNITYTQDNRSVTGVILKSYIGDKKVLVLTSNVSANGLNHLFGVNQPNQDKLDELSQEPQA